MDVSWRIQLAGWRIVFEPKALCWILMPETLRGLWRQRLRWSEGGAAVMLEVLPRFVGRLRHAPPAPSTFTPPLPARSAAADGADES